MTRDITIKLLNKEGKEKEELTQVFHVDGTCIGLGTKKIEELTKVISKLTSYVESIRSANPDQDYKNYQMVMEVKTN